LFVYACVFAGYGRVDENVSGVEALYMFVMLLKNQIDKVIFSQLGT
jgi:hypothetical protein